MSTVKELRAEADDIGLDWKWAWTKAELQNELAQHALPAPTPEELFDSATPEERENTLEALQDPEAAKKVFHVITEQQRRDEGVQLMPDPKYWVAEHALQNGPALHGPASLFRTSTPSSPPPGGGVWVPTNERPAWARYVK